VLVRGLRAVSLGLALGVLGSVALSRLASAWLRGVEPRDPLTNAGTALILAALGLLAACIPAERATRVDPWRALRET
jgi:putative ABC transport system permease protein